jgi:hypothetical protein
MRIGATLSRLAADRVAARSPASVIDDAPHSATSDEMTAIDAFNDRLRADGQ